MPSRLNAARVAHRFTEYKGKSDAWLKEEWERLEEERAGVGYGPKPVNWVPRSVSNPEIIERQTAIRTERGLQLWQRTFEDAHRVTRMPQRKHRELVVRALREGEDVPAEVLADYPGLKGRRAMKMAPEPGYKTLVRDDSAKNLPSDLDRTPDSAAPLPGSATPGGAGRDIPRFETNTPDNDIDQRPRTLGLPGEEYGHPSNDTYNTVTRRTMTAAEIAVRTVMRRMGSWMRFKGYFPGVQSPLFHATTGPRAANIALRGQGLKSDSGFSSFGGQTGISMSRDLASLLRGDFGKVILVFDQNELKTKFGVEPVQHPSAPDEYEERVWADHIPASMIRGVILNWKPLPFELEEWQSLVDYPVVYQVKRGGPWAKAAALEGFEKEAFKQQWSPGKRQRKQRGQSRVKSRNYYRRNKTNLKRKAKIWRRKNKNNGALRNSNKRRRRQVRKRRGFLESVQRVASRFAGGDFSPARERGGEGGSRQREQSNQEKREDAKYYRRNRSKRQQQSERHYKTKCQPNNRCLERREKWQEDPEFYERGRPTSRAAGLLTVPEIAFGIGPDMAMGYVRAVSPMTGMVTFEMRGAGQTIWESIPVEVFVRVAAFLSDEDIEAFFDLVDAEIGLEAYEDLDEEGLRTCASLYDKDPDSDEFRGQCFDLTGKDDLSTLSGSEMDQVNDSLVLGVLEGGGDPRSGEPEDREEGDETIGDEYDPHLYYGEVEMEKADDEEES